MKNLILFVLILLSFTACQKGETTPPKTITATKDTIPDKGAFYARVVTNDSAYYCEIKVTFNHSFHTYYDGNEDAIVPISYPPVLLSAISSDGRILNSDGVPYTSGMSIPLAVNVRTTGLYFLRANRFLNIPSTIHIWCKDNYLKDSLDLRTGDYHFNIDNADTNSFGKRRFQLVVR